MADYSRLSLVGDFGNTFISLGIADIDELTIDHFALLSTDDFEGPMDAIQRYLKSIPQCPDRVGLAFAGELEGDAISLTRRGWRVTKEEVRAATGARQVTLINDIDALARALPSLQAHDFASVGIPAEKNEGTSVLIVAGSGLSIAAVMPATTGPRLIRGDGGAISMPASEPDEFDPQSLSPHGRPRAEDVLSGVGIARLYRAICEKASNMPKQLSAPQIVQLGLSGEDAAASEAVRLTATWLARLAGDMALLFGASAGVYLAGGLCANVVPFVSANGFRGAFADKGRAREHLEQLPIRVVKTAADAGLRGAALALAEESDEPGLLPHRLASS